MLNGRDRILRSLLDPHKGKFIEFCRDYRIGPGIIKFDESTISLLHTPDGRMLNDITSIEENEYAANQVNEIIKTLTTDSTTRIHASAAGGRKTLGLHLLNAMQLYGRPQDRLSHILVSEELETHPEFFYIPPMPRELKTRDGRTVSTSTARIHLVDIPFRRDFQPFISDATKERIPYKVLRLERYFQDRTPEDDLLRPNLSNEVCRNIRTALRYLGYKVADNEQ